MTNGALRPPRTTPNLGLPVPGDAGPADQVTVTGELADALDALYARLLFQPGDIKASAASAPTTGWLLCDGSAHDRAQFSTLFAAIGTAYGAGDGSTTFNVPDFRDRFPRGEATPANLGVRGGEASHTITTAEMPWHAHGSSTANDNADHAHYVSGQTAGRSVGHTHPSGPPGYYLVGSAASVALASWAPQAGHTPCIMTNGPLSWGGTGGEDTDHSHGFGVWSGGASARHAHGINAEGGGAAHNNLPPYQSVNYFVKT